MKKYLFLLFLLIALPVYGADHVTDGMGSPEGVTGGLGSGGGGITMTDTGGTWSFVTGAAVNTPTLGEELLSDAGFAAACDGGAGHWTCESGWSIGSGIATASSSSTRIYETNKLTIGGWYSVSFDILTLTANGFSPSDGKGNFNPAVTTTGNGKLWTNKSTDTTIAISARLGATSGTIDNVSLKQLSLPTLFLTAPLSTAHVVASADLTIPAAGVQAGIAVRLDSAASPTKGFVCYHDGSVTVKCDEFTAATTWTNKLTLATGVNYSAGAKLVVITDGTAWRCYYNNVLAGNGTMDAGITGTLHGLFSTASTSSIDNLTIYARGNENNYGILDMFVN